MRTRTNEALQRSLEPVPHLRLYPNNLGIFDDFGRIFILNTVGSALPRRIFTRALRKHRIGIFVPPCAVERARPRILPLSFLPCLLPFLSLAPFFFLISSLRFSLSFFLFRPGNSRA